MYCWGATRPARGAARANGAGGRAHGRGPTRCKWLSFLPLETCPRRAPRLARAGARASGAGSRARGPGPARWCTTRPWTAAPPRCPARPPARGSMPRSPAGGTATYLRRCLSPHATCAARGKLQAVRLHATRLSALAWRSACETDSVNLVNQTPSMAAFGKDTRKGPRGCDTLDGGGGDNNRSRPSSRPRQGV